MKKGKELLLVSSVMCLVVLVLSSCVGGWILGPWTVRIYNESGLTLVFHVSAQDDPWDYGDGELIGPSMSPEFEGIPHGYWIGIYVMGLIEDWVRFEPHGHTELQITQDLEITIGPGGTHIP